MKCQIASVLSALLAASNAQAMDPSNHPVVQPLTMEVKAAQAEFPPPRPPKARSRENQQQPRNS